MDYRCPKCRRALPVRKLFFRDVTACGRCGQKVVLGDFLAFAMASLAMCVSALSALYLLSHDFEQYIVAAGYAVSIGMLSGIAVLLLLGRATAFRRGRSRARARAVAPAAPASEPGWEPTRVERH
jgi:DNA-directed RNA polymerase subunit RPC12/RpoP